MPSTIACNTFLFAAFALLSYSFAGLILIESISHTGLLFLARQLNNGIVTGTSDVTRACPISFDPTTQPFNINGFGGSAWHNHHTLALALNSANAAFSTSSQMGSLVLSGAPTAVLATPQSPPAADTLSTNNPSYNDYETAIFHYNPLTQEITAKWIDPSHRVKNVVFTLDTTTMDIGVVPTFPAHPPATLQKVRLYLVGSYSMAGIVFDPHFKGFNGEKYDVQGKSNTWFNLITDSDLQVNGFFQSIEGINENNTWIRSIGMNIGSHRVFINTTSVTVDEVLLHDMQNHGEKEMALNANDIKFTVLGTFQGVTVQTSAYVVSISLRRTIPVNGVPQPFLNIDDMEMLDSSRTPHGLLGQSAQHKADSDAATPHGKQGQGMIEGVYTDYVVSSAYAKDFKYNKFSY